MTRLTRRQRTVYEYLRDHRRDWPDPPTLEELCTALGLSSRGSMHKHVQALVDAGLVEPMEGKHRGVRLVEPDRVEAVSLPFVGRIAAGLPVEGFETHERIDVPAFLLSNDRCFVLEAKGESMIEAGILDGDLLVVAQRNHARDGEIVVALVGGDESTLKRIEQRPDRVTLHPANVAFEPMSYPPDQVQIQGVLIAQMRSYR